MQCYASLSYLYSSSCIGISPDSLGNADVTVSLSVVSVSFVDDVGDGDAVDVDDDAVDDEEVEVDGRDALGAFLLINRKT